MASRREFLHFFSSLGFEDNPFAYTNADEEERLSEYFVPPPYFESVFGNPNRPKSFIVFAPRGGGKTAQRRMIEQQSVDNGVLAITYDNFDFHDVNKATDIKVHHHLRRIIRFVLTGLLLNLSRDSREQDNLSKEDKQIFLKLSAEHLGDIKGADLEITLEALKSLRDKFKDFWNDWVPVMGIGLQFVLKLIKPIKDLGDNISELQKFHDPEFHRTDSLKFQLKLLVDLAKKLGWKSIYILVDRVDEASTTGNNVKASFSLLEPLLKDLSLLEFSGIGFKFFLWDQLEPLCKNIVRTDRIRQESLDWDNQMLMALWENRLRAYSAKKISRLEQITAKLKIYSVDELCLIFSNHSPRDLIRLGNQILSEQQEHRDFSAKIHEKVIYKAIDKFCAKRSSELIVKETVLEGLKRTRQVDFTIPYLSNTVFKEKGTSTRNRLMSWRAENAIVEVERVDNPSSRGKNKVKLFAIKDIRVAKAIYPELDVLNFLSAKYKKCPQCNASVIRDWGEVPSSNICQDCQYDLSEEADNLEKWQRQDIAVSKRRQYRETSLDENAMQLSLFDGMDNRDDE
ncbi:MAG: hypothetical protein HN560_17575 [Anaerolineae bacterium]|jgi:hypothetical protein|nr:hypothetical protein [Anaerolineae bacterium]MBT7602860.1 hypothetical protein [Anaerolineae bacterium]MBT7781619.1 hypothetical protein [Anaerolineae bacterium]